MNVLVYSGPGTTVESVRQCTESLRKLLSPFYAVISVDARTLQTEPWSASTSLVAIPGGADLPYCRELDGRGNEALRKFVRQGGRYLGFCAGGYFGSGRCEFEVGDPVMEVSGSRELAFFPGTCRGSTYAGFKYASHSGARATPVKVNSAALGGAVDFTCYFNGGGYFVNAQSYAKKGVEVLATYTDTPDVKDCDEENPAAVVYCKVGNGHAVLTGIHPEFSHTVGVDSDDIDTSVVSTLEKNNVHRLAFLRAALSKMGLKVNSDESDTSIIPRLTPLKLTAQKPNAIAYLVDLLGREVGFTGPRKNILVGNNDTFEFVNTGDNTVAVSDSEKLQTDEMQDDSPMSSLTLNDDSATDLNKVVKVVHVYRDSRPNSKETPYFNHDAYYNSLEVYQAQHRVRGELGSVLLYGEVVTSTSTMLDKNYSILRNLPSGLIAVGTIQVSGRGRGNNVWVNPPGVLAVSGVLRIPLASHFSTSSPIILVQYIVSLAMVEAIRGFGPGYDELDVRLKWPNDVYARTPPGQGGEEYTKIGGVIVNSNVFDSEYTLVFGCGTNVSNPAPTTSLNLVLSALNKSRQAAGQSKLPSFRGETLLALFLTKLESMLDAFKYQGFETFEKLYYKRWLHNDQIVTLEQYDNTKAVIRGITTDFGLLVVEEVDRNDVPKGRKFELQPDGNSFDMFRGLLKKKV